MNTRNLLITVGVAAVATVNLMAADVALSPRAADHQTKTIAGTNNDPNLAAGRSISISPRSLDRQVRTVAGTDTTVSPSLMCVRTMTGSPKDISACADHPGAPMPCCSVAASK